MLRRSRTNKRIRMEKFVQIKSLQESNPREYKKQLKQNKLTEEQLNKKILELDPTAKIAEVKDDKEAFNLLEIPDSVNGRTEERKEEAKIFEECKRRKRKSKDKEANFKNRRGKRETT